MELYENFEEAKKAYLEYVDKHINGVKTAFNMFADNLCEYFAPDIDDIKSVVEYNVGIHDQSKYSDAELIPYIQKFNPWIGMNKTKEEVEKEFDAAWKHHYSVNKHHPEGWVITSTDGADIVLRMTPDKVIEMLLDWISMSLIRDQSVYDWWVHSNNGRSEKQGLLHPEVFKMVDDWIEENKQAIDFTKES